MLEPLIPKEAINNMNANLTFMVDQIPMLKLGIITIIVLLIINIVVNLMVHKKK